MKWIYHWKLGDSSNYRTVLIDGYREATSFEGFTRRQGREAHKFSIKEKTHKHYSSYVATDSTFEMEMRLETDAEMAVKFPDSFKVTTVDHTEMSLQEFFHMIGWNPKTKHICGLTFRQYYKHQLIN